MYFCIVLHHVDQTDQSGLMNFKIWTLKWLEPSIFSLLQNVTIPNNYKVLVGESDKVDDLNIFFPPSYETHTFSQSHQKIN